MSQARVQTGKVKTYNPTKQKGHQRVHSRRGMVDALERCAAETWTKVQRKNISRTKNNLPRREPISYRSAATCTRATPRARLFIPLRSHQIDVWSSVRRVPGEKYTRFNDVTNSSSRHRVKTYATSMCRLHRLVYVVEIHANARLPC